MWELKKNGRAEPTIATASAVLTRLSKLCDINEPEQVKTIIASRQWKNSTKKSAVKIMNGYLRYIGKTWQPPRYIQESELPFIPTEEELDILIASAGRRLSALLQLLKETGARIGEIQRLKWQDIDTQRKIVYIRAEKGSNSRISAISDKTLAMLNRIPKPNERVFQANKHSIRVNFEVLRNRIATKLNNPRLKAIHLHTFRHWKATTEYHKTRDIIHVKAVLGHKDIESTMVYINIESGIYNTGNDEYTARIAHDEQEAITLIETGFEYVATMGTNQLYRKRK